MSAQVIEIKTNDKLPLIPSEVWIEGKFGFRSTLPKELIKMQLETIFEKLYLENIEVRIVR
jgi:hypothetical protein